MNEIVILQEIPPCVQAAMSHKVVFRRHLVTFLQKPNVSIYENFCYEILVSWNIKTLTNISHYENLAPYGMLLVHDVKSLTRVMGILQLCYTITLVSLLFVALFA